jgi:hypothetical protein
MVCITTVGKTYTAFTGSKFMKELISEHGSFFTFFGKEISSVIE